ncbi:MAG: PDZ domain-containing protein [Chloroflexi bacterium]|nr:PDZ domain-containing protein [Chloroflexota bacterium]
MPYTEYDVSTNQEKAREMVQKSGQMGVPVITVDGQVVIGFNRQRLEQLLAQGPQGQPQGAPQPPHPSLGLSIADAQRQLPGTTGAYVGSVDATSPGGKAGILEGDIITEIKGRPVAMANDVAKAMAEVKPGENVPVTVLRQGQQVKVQVAF